MTKPLFGTPTKPANVIDVNAIMPAPDQYLPVTTQENNRSVALRVVTDQEIDKLGSANAQRAASTSKAILETVKASDTEQFGSQLNQLIAVSKGLDPTKMQKKGIVGAITNLFGNAKEKMLSELQTVEQRMTTLTGEMDKSVILYTKRIGDIEKMLIENEQVYNALGQEVLLAEQLLQLLNHQLANEPPPTDAFGATRLDDINERILRCEKKIDDLKRSQTICTLAVPELRMMKNSSRSLAETFTTIKLVTIPAYMGAFSRYILNLEAKKGAEMATAVQDMTNEAFRASADLLRDNVQIIAKAKARSVIDIETLQHMQTQLLASYDDAKRIADEARKARQEAAPKLIQMEQELVSRFNPQQITH